MSNFNWSFNANEVDPASGGQSWAPGLYPIAITGHEVKAAGSGNGGLVEFEITALGGANAGSKMKFRLNLFNESDQAREIAKRELSAISHVTGVMQFADLNALSQLHGIPFQVEIGLQKPPKVLPDNQTLEQWTARQYTEVKGFRDAQGNAPAKGKPAGQGQGQRSDSGPQGGNQSAPGGGNWGGGGNGGNNGGNGGSGGGSSDGPSWGGGGTGGNGGGNGGNAGGGWGGGSGDNNGNNGGGSGTGWKA